MKTKNEQGRTIALIVGVYFVIKSVLNLILGGGISDIFIAAGEAILLFTGLVFVNYVVAALTLLIVLRYMKDNLSNVSENIIYIIEGVIDIVCAVVLCAVGSVREHFSNKPGELCGKD